MGGEVISSPLSSPEQKKKPMVIACTGHVDEAVIELAGIAGFEAVFEAPLTI